MLDQVGRYRVIRRLGSGAFATVWLAEDDVLASLVAIKVLADNWTHNLDVRARFLAEAQIMRRADSDRLVRVLDIGELPDGRPYLVMTYAPGGTLADRLAIGAMPVDRAVRTAAEIARGVAVLHEVGVIHRDLKPSNVLLADQVAQERILIADLGLAKAIAYASGFTVIAGSPGHMAPEQAVPGGGIDVRADVYAIGALAYHMLTGRPPHAVSSIEGVLATAAARPERPSKLRPGIPSRVDDVVLRALRRDPRDRWPSALALAEALESAAEAGPAPRWRSARAGGRRWLAGPVAVAASAAVAFGVVGSSAQPQWTRVEDSSHRLSVAVPSVWATQIRDAGWNPATVGLPAGHAVGLVVGPDLAAWADPTSEVPGVFVGASRSLRGGAATLALPDHERCTRLPERQVAVSGFTARIQRFSRCGGTAVSFSEIVLTPDQGDYGIYVEVKQVDQVDRTDDILRSLSVDSAFVP